MRMWQLKYLVLIIATVFLFAACGGSSGSAGITSNGPDTSVNPDNGILPYNPPASGAPLEDVGGNGSGGGGGGNGGGNNGSGGGDNNGGDQQPVPEPSTLVLVGSGLALITLCRKKKMESERKQS